MNWKNFWKNQSTPLHAEMSEKAYKLYGEELLILLDKYNCNISCRVLEIACGDGSFFKAMNLENTQKYKGIDISEKLLSIFKSNFPDVNVEENNAITYNDGQKYDLIFGNGFLQYLRPAEFSVALSNYKRMLDENGIILISNVPFKPLKFSYYSGQIYGSLINGKPIGLIRSIAGFLGLSNSSKQMGYWYSLKEIKKVAKENQMNFYIHGCLFYPYRISIIMTNAK